MEKTRKRILCVEDDEDTCQLIIYLLGRANYEVVAVGTISDGLRRAQSDRYDLYLLDHLLPDGTGIELCQQLRALAPYTPILFCSAAAYDSDRENALGAGAQAYLTKPLDLDYLEETISRLLGGPAT